MTKDQCWYIDLFISMHDYRYTFTIVVNRNHVLFSILNGQKQKPTINRIKFSQMTQVNKQQTYGLISILIVSIFLSRCLLSAALTRISSKILYKPGTQVISLEIIFACSVSQTHICCLTNSTEPIQVSGRRSTCSKGVFFWQTLSTRDLKLGQN